MLVNRSIRYVLYFYTDKDQIITLLPVIGTISTKCLKDCESKIYRLIYDVYLSVSPSTP